MQGLNGLLRRVPVWAVYLAGTGPLILTVLQGMAGGLGADPVKALEHALGLTALQFLVAGLAVTPLRRFAGLNLLRFRRALGLLAFFYMALHFTVWVALDLQFRWAEIGTDLTKRPYIIVGMVALMLAVPLAMSSNDSAVRRLGPQVWRRLHRLAYVIGPLGAVHFVMTGKTWAAESLIYLGLTAFLLALRLTPRRALS